MMVSVFCACCISEIVAASEILEGFRHCKWEFFSTRRAELEKDISLLMALENKFKKKFVYEKHQMFSVEFETLNAVVFSEF